MPCDGPFDLGIALGGGVSACKCGAKQRSRHCRMTSLSLKLRRGENKQRTLETQMKKIRWALALIGGAAVIGAQAQPPSDPDRRAADIVARMTLDEKIRTVFGY